MINKILLYSLILFLFGLQNTYAQDTGDNLMKCVGNTGSITVNVIYDKNASTLEVNGVKSKATVSDNVLVTQKYVSARGIYVYSTLDLSSLKMTQSDAATGNPIASATLTCDN